MLPDTRLRLLLLFLLTGILSACDTSVDTAARELPDARSVTNLADTESSPPDSESCRQCHAAEVEAWQGSHHALANRDVSPEFDHAVLAAAPVLSEGGVHYEFLAEGESFTVTESHNGEARRYPLAGVIGHEPIRQYLAQLPGGKLQAFHWVHEENSGEWLNLFEGEQREPGEWGHWRGQGMNWNANCGYCHMTDYRKQFDFASDSYATTWSEQGIGCATCHGGLQAHVEAATAGRPLEATPVAVQPGAVCASCHSRRDQLTADAFVPGDNYHDHFRLMLPERAGLYYPDGQVRDEVFVYGSFAGSRMHHAGVTCLNCHNPHTLETVLPVENNQLCMQCHLGGTLGAPVIEPTAHSFHAEGSEGNQCVNCHMPETTYMRADDRADHGFLKPDPLMTRELGIPNACSSCHSDQSLSWAVKWAERWYGGKLEGSLQRRRARALDAAYQQSPQAVPLMVALFGDEDIPAWRATYVALLGQFLSAPEAVAVVQQAMQDPDPMVRARAADSLARLPQEAGREGLSLLRDQARVVRMAAAHSLLGAGAPLPSDRVLNDELDSYLEFHSDRPQVLLLRAVRANQQGQSDKTADYVERAVTLDQGVPDLYHQGGILLSAAGLNDRARDLLQRGANRFPDVARFPYSLGLLAAEEGAMSEAIEQLEQAVYLDPNFSRAWYNLSLAYRHLGENLKADQAMSRARGV